MSTTIYKQNTFLYNTEKCCYQSDYIVIHLSFCDCPAACSVVEEVMLQEAFNLPSTRILSLYALGNYLATRPQLSVSVPTANIQYFSHLFSKWKISFIWKRQMTETDSVMHHHEQIYLKIKPSLVSLCSGVRGAGAGSVTAHLWTDTRQLSGTLCSATWQRSPRCVFPPSSVLVPLRHIINPPTPPPSSRKGGDVKRDTCCLQRNAPLLGSGLSGPSSRHHGESGVWWCQAAQRHGKNREIQSGFHFLYGWVSSSYTENNKF